MATADPPPTSADGRHSGRAARRGRVDRATLSKKELHDLKRRRKRARVRRARLRNAWLKPLIAVVRRLPLRVACALGDLVGRVLFLFLRGYRARALANLAIAFGDEMDDRARRDIARRNFRVMGRSALAYFVYHRLGTERVLAHIRVEGEEHLRDALAQGSGALFVGAHAGLAELASCWLAARYGGIVVGRLDHGTSAMRMLYEMREDLGCRTIRRGDPRAILRTLKQNEPVAMLIDHAIDDVQGVFLPFLGRLAMTVTGHAALSHRTGAPVVPASIEWDSPTTHLLRLRPAMTARSDLPRAEAIVELTARVSAEIEDVIRRRPDHWSWIHKKWDERPEDHPDHPVHDASAT